MVFSYDAIVGSLLALNSTSEYLRAVLIFIFLFIIFKLFDSTIIGILKKAKDKTKNTFDDVIIDFIDGIHWPFYVYLAIYLSTLSLNLPQSLEVFLKHLLMVFVIFYAAKGVINIVTLFLDRYKDSRKKKNKNTSESMINVLKLISKIILWIVAFLMILSNFGIEITPLIAGLGIGGIAIGLALQNVLGDLFSAFAIYFDKPFEEGDFIIIGNDMGVIKHIGIKTTRIQALGGQELVVSNSELTSTRINNYKKMNKRRVLFSFGVEYKTKVTQLRKIKKIVEKIIKDEKHTTLDRVHFKSFGPSSLDFEVVYYIDTNDYNVYMDVQERINLKIKQNVEKEGVDFAFPSTTVYMRKE